MKPVILNLDGIDGNAFALMGAFAKAARSQGRTQEEVSAVLEEAKSGDYNHLLRVLLENTRTPV